MTESHEQHLRQIWQVVAAIPRGTTMSYGQVAARAGLPRRARMVGRALGVAPDELGLPWHRVVRADGRIGLPAGSAGYRSQCRKLKAEGLDVRDGRVAGGGTSDRATSLDETLWS